MTVLPPCHCTSTGKPFTDANFTTAPQKIPGKILCAYYDTGGEGIAYHDNTPKNLGSGTLNKPDGTYLNEFRKDEAVDISYTKNHNDIDNNPFNQIQPPDGLLYVGWTEPGEWFNLTVQVARSGTYEADLLYTANRGGTISLDVNGKDATGPITISSTFDAADPIAWRQWHHWNKLYSLTSIKIKKGPDLLTLHIVETGNMNFDYLEFTKQRQP